MHKAHMFGIIAALAITLTGCASGPQASAGDGANTTPADTTQTEAAPAITAAPVQTEFTGPEADYLAGIKTRQDLPDIAAATDEQLVATGHKACELLATDPDPANLRLIEGEQLSAFDTYAASLAIGGIAAERLCGK